MQRATITHKLLFTFTHT